ncbi:hypothetical protein FKM82_010571 [Ascaphus truei]
METVCSYPTSAARVRFFCTAGRGMERFVADEVTCKASAEEVEAMSGKVFFTAEPDLGILKKLKSGERLFLLLKKGPPLSLPKYKGNAVSVLRECMIGEPHMWLNALALWQKLQEPLKQQQDICSNRGEAQKRNLEGDPATHISKMCKVEQTTGDSVCQLQDQTNEKPVNHSEEQDVLHGEEENNSKHQPLPNQPSQTFTFRVSCRCTGANAKMFTAQEVGRVLGVSLVKQFGWKPDLRRPDLEVFVHLNDNYSVVGLPILRHPLASRGYIQSTGLRSTTAWAMASLAEIQAGSLVLDPMCGVGTLLFEAAKEWPDVHFLGIDLSDSQLKSAVGNVEAAGLADSIELLKGSVLELPLLSESVDVVISDIPFGKKFTTSKDIKELLPDILQEMARVLRVGGTIVLLLSQNLHRHLKASYQFKAPESTSVAATENDSLHQDKNESTTNKEEIGKSRKQDWLGSLVPVESHAVSLGVTEAVIFKCKKTFSTSVAL